MKQRVIRALRNAGWLSDVDHIRFMKHRIANSSRNRSFLRRARGFVPPPAQLLYETSSSVNYESYFTGGQEWAAKFSALIERFSPGAEKVCEWGCGVGRLIRHMSATHLVGIDYDERMVEWCRSALPHIEFYKNELMPPTNFAPGEFDAVYCWSVFTHLSEAAHYAWLLEFARIIRPGGVFIFTTHGDFCAENYLSVSERRRYDAGDLVIRSSEREGERIFAAYQSPAFMQKLLSGFNILAHFQATSSATLQDVWAVRM